ncbi:MAG: YbdK family carboxylate-amine ligase [Sphingobacteriia bacterium]|nr:YbdK family carboxylate-amine ligase [Sphingobacteriia bacterium]
MADLFFEPSKHLTLGVEIELQLIDPNNFNLYPKALEILKLCNNAEKIKPELFQSMLEINTGICNNVHEVKEDIKQTTNLLYNICKQIGVECATTGTHPFARYVERKLFPSERYRNSIDRNQWIARRLSIFGLHVHIGMKSGEECIKFMNLFQKFLPHLITISASSPFWQAKDTGLSSSRLSIFEASPTSGHCQWMYDWNDLSEQVNALINCGAIKSTKDLWWDLRPSPDFGTLEIRVCDGIATLNELLAIVAFIHTLAHWYENLSNAQRKDLGLLEYIPLWLIRENKWRAMRYGFEMDLIKNNSGETIPIRKDFINIINQLNEVSEKLGYQEYFTYLFTILKHGNSATRQKKYFNKHKSFKKVAEFNVKEFKQSFIG